MSKLTCIVMSEFFLLVCNKVNCKVYLILSFLVLSKNPPGQYKYDLVQFSTEISSASFGFTTKIWIFISFFKKIQVISSRFQENIWWVRGWKWVLLGTNGSILDNMYIIYIMAVIKVWVKSRYIFEVHSTNKLFLSVQSFEHFQQRLMNNVIFCEFMSTLIFQENYCMEVY